MKKFFITILLSLVVFSSALSYFHPQRAQAYLGVGDIVTDIGTNFNTLRGLANDIKTYALQAKQYVTETLQLNELISTAKTAAEIYGVGKETYDFIAQENYGAIVKSVLGYAGLGSLSPVMNKFLNGVGLKDILVDEVGGALGLGGILQGGLQGIFTQNDTISSLLGQLGLKIPSGTLGKLKDLGIFSPEGIMKAITCGSGSGSTGTPQPAKESTSGWCFEFTPPDSTIIQKNCSATQEACAEKEKIWPASNNKVTKKCTAQGGQTSTEGKQPSDSTSKWCFGATHPDLGPQPDSCSDTKALCEETKTIFASGRNTVTACTEKKGQNSTGVQGAQTGPAGSTPEVKALIAQSDRGNQVPGAPKDNTPGLPDTKKPAVLESGGGSQESDGLSPAEIRLREQSREIEASSSWCFTYTPAGSNESIPYCTSATEAECKEKEAVFRSANNRITEECKPKGGQSSTGGTPSSGGSAGGCGARGGIVSDPKVIKDVKDVLRKYGLTGLNDEEVAKLVDQGIVDVETAKQHIAPSLQPVASAPPQISPPCTGWNEATGGCSKVRTSFSDNADNTKDIPTDPAAFILRFFTILLGIAGGIALLLMLAAGYKLITSSGKPEGIQQGREQLTAAIVGLLFIIFSFVIFQLIVVDILKIPGICKDANDPRCQKSAASQSQPDPNQFKQNPNQDKLQKTNQCNVTLPDGKKGTVDCGLMPPGYNTPETSNNDKVSCKTVAQEGKNDAGGNRMVCEVTTDRVDLKGMCRVTIQDKGAGEVPCDDVPIELLNNPDKNNPDKVESDPDKVLCFQDIVQGNPPTTTYRCTKQ